MAASLLSPPSSVLQHVASDVPVSLSISKLGKEKERPFPAADEPSWGGGRCRVSAALYFELREAQIEASGSPWLAFAERVSMTTHPFLLRCTQS